MGIKSTISKVHTQTFNKGFTLLELIVGMTIFSIVGGLALNSLVESSKSFSDDKRKIESNQNLSAALGIIGNDIKQAGELINDNRFPVVTIEDNPSNTGSSMITIRRALIPSLTLCVNKIAAASPTTLIVADDSVTATAGCRATGSLSTTTSPATVVRPNSLKVARDYRCKLDNINADYTAFATTDFCGGGAIEKVRAAMSDSSGNIWQFDYTNDAVDTTGSPAPAVNTKFNIGIDNASASTPTGGINYPAGTPIYLIEERIYRLGTTGNLTLQKDGGVIDTLISGIAKFNVSARVYGDTTTKTVNSSPASPCTIAQDPDAATSTEYTCTFTPSATYNWKTLAGIKVRLQAKYDPTGGNATPTTTDLDKLTARAEYFPRNVLSR